MPSGNRKKVRTITLVETPEQYERQIDSLKKTITALRAELKELRAFESVQAAIAAARHDLEMVVRDKDEEMLHLSDERVKVRAKRTEVERMLSALQEQRRKHERLVEDHRERVAADLARLAVREREAKAQENRALQACEAAAEKEEGAERAWANATDALDDWQNESQRVRRLFALLAGRRLQIGLDRFFLEAERAHHRVAFASALWMQRAALRDLARAKEQAEESRAMSVLVGEKRAQVSKALRESENSLLDLEREEELDRARKCELDARERRLNEVERRQGKREARLLGWEQQLKDRDRRLNVAAADIGKRVARDAERPSQ